MSAEFSPHMLAQEIEDADTLYVANRDLDIVYVNEGWASFASENKGQELLKKGWNENLLANVSGKQRDRWRHIYRLLLAGRLPHHQEQMNCSSPTERRIYELRITPQHDEQGEVAWLIHHNVRIDNMPDAVDRVSRQLEQIDQREKLGEEFQRRIVERKIRIPSFDVARYFEPLDEIGGDLVWHREYPNGVSDLIHADVMGHGEAAGRLAAKMAVVLDEVASLDLSPSQTVRALNEAVTRLTPKDEIMFATGLCFRFEQDLQRVTCCNFGHEGPIFSRTGPIQLAPCYPIGMKLPNEKWQDTPIELSEHGTGFLVFSDGITEQFDPDGHMFGIEGLHDAFRRHLEAPLEERVRRIVEELSTFRGSALIKDDQTLLALEFVGSA